MLKRAMEVKAVDDVSWLPICLKRKEEEEGGRKGGREEGQGENVLLIKITRYNSMNATSFPPFLPPSLPTKT